MLRTTKLITISLLPDLFNQVNKIAKEENRTKSELFREAIRNYIEEKEWQKLSRYGQVMAQRQGLQENDIYKIVEDYRDQ